MNIQSVSDAHLSPDGKNVVCVITSARINSRQTNIVLIDILSKKQKTVAEGESPQWSPDGKWIAYLGDHNGSTAIFIYDVVNNSKEFLVNIYESDYFIDHYAVNNFCWSPDGKAIAYVSTEPFTKSDDKPLCRELTHLLYKSKGGRGRQNYADNRRTHIWIISIEEKIPRPVFINEYDQHSISFSPDGKKICFISNTTGTPDLNQWSRVFSVDIVTGEINKISNEKGSAFLPAWSPDGKYITYMRINSEISTNDSPAEDTQLYIIPSSSGGVAKCLTRSLDRRIEQISWDPSSTSIYFTTGNTGDTILYRVSILSGEIESIISTEGKVIEYSISNDGKKIIYVHTDATHVADVFIYDIENQTKIQLTHFGEDLLNECTLQPAETFWYKSFDGTNVQGWVIKPYNFDQQNKYPLILVIHGGPHNMFGYEFEDRMQLLSANGYGVLYINPRGSSGYGQEFSNGCMKAWGEGDYNDLMYGVDAAIENNKWIDASRLGVTGQSYGGYMTNRIITKTQRFKAAVADGSISNLISFAGTSLYHSLMESEYQLSVYDNYDELWKCSPLRDVKNVSTPVLFLHGETDNEVPISQAEEMFIALKKLGVTTSLVQYVGEGHGWRPDLKPDAKIDLLTRMIGWFDMFLKNEKVSEG
ncbi:MAG: S9 family peptidase [Bacteroidota bacterium]|nr:S9 family peptidase [Bacteroidota bacterium]